MRRTLFALAILILVVVGYIVFKIPSYKTIDIESALSTARLNLNYNQEIIRFYSKNPFNFYDILHNQDKISDQEVYGILTRPVQKTSYPLIIGVAGSYGWADHHYGYLERYLEMGIAVLSLHSFESRGVTSTVGEQTSVTTAMVIYDAFMALDTLSRDDKIDADRIGITGWSLGGGVALFTAWQPIQNSISPNYKFAAHLPLYPPCVAKPELMEFTDAPIHILIGELDNWVPAEACEDIVNALYKLGHNIDITVYPDAHHSFDRIQELVNINYAYSFTDCRLNISIDGVVKTKAKGFPLSTPMMQKIGLAFCADRGVTYGGNKEAREKSKAYAMYFMKKNLID